MSAPQPTGQELTSWKEIAAFLGVSVRTAQLWESQRGLPVRRLPGGRSRVSVAVAELEAWQHAHKAPPQPPQTEMRPRRRTAARAALASGAVVLCAALLWLGLRRPPQPASLYLEGSALAVLDARGGELWRKNFQAPLVPLYSPGARRTWIGDLEGDGRAEVLFSPVVGDSAEAPLICYTDDGAEKWRFMPVREVATQSTRFSRSYRAETFTVFRLGSRNVIAVVSNHADRHPAQVALLSPAGTLEREYWHSGNLLALEAADLDRDGVPELYAGGASVSRRAATLLQLDPEHMAGASLEPEDGGYQLLGFPPTEERARLIFPRSCISLLADRHNAVSEILLEPGRLTAAVRESVRRPVSPRIFYDLTAGLALQSVLPGEGFRSLHRALEQRGELNHPFSAAEEESLRQIRRVP